MMMRGYERKVKSQFVRVHPALHRRAARVWACGAGARGAAISPNYTHEEHESCPAKRKRIRVPRYEVPVSYAYACPAPPRQRNANALKRVRRAKPDATLAKTRDRQHEGPVTLRRRETALTFHLL